MNRIISIIILCQLFPAFLAGKEHDFGVWSSLEVKSKITDNCRLSLSTESRFNNFATRFDKQNSELGGSYSVGKSVSFGAAYRLSQSQNKASDIKPSHRISVDAAYEHKLGRLKLKYRVKYQQTYSKLYIYERRFMPKRLVRTKLSASYKILASRYAPFCAAEIYVPLETNSYDALISKVRFTAGTSITFTKRISADVFYLYQPDFAVPLSAVHIAGIGLSYKL